MTGPCSQLENDSQELSADRQVPSLLLSSLAKVVGVWQDSEIMLDPKPLLGLSWDSVPPCTRSEPCTMGLQEQGRETSAFA